MSHVLAEEPKDEDDKSRDEKKVPARHTYTYYYSKYVDSSIALNVRPNDVYL